MRFYAGDFLLNDTLWLYTVLCNLEVNIVKPKKLRIENILCQLAYVNCFDVWLLYKWERFIEQ